jgi:hypothetical protein
MSTVDKDLIEDSTFKIELYIGGCGDDFDDESYYPGYAYLVLNAYSLTHENKLKKTCVWESDPYDNDELDRAKHLRVALLEALKELEITQPVIDIDDDCIYDWELSFLL